MILKFSSKANPSEAFTEYLKLIQTDTSSLNIDNYTTLPSSKVSFFITNEPISGAKEFYAEYFSNKCEKLKTVYEDLEKQDVPF